MYTEDPIKDPSDVLDYKTDFANTTNGGSKEDFLELFRETQAEAALAATLFHDKILSIGELKIYLAENQVPIRLVEESECNGSTEI